MDNLRGGAAGGNNSQLLREFRKIDKDMNGYITRSELMEVLKATGEKFTKKDIDDMMASADADGDGKVNYQGKCVECQCLYQSILFNFLLYFHLDYRYRIGSF